MLSGGVPGALLQDPPCGAYSQALLYFKGFHSIQVHRIAHELWQSGRKVMALALQSRMSEVFAGGWVGGRAGRDGKCVGMDGGGGRGRTVWREGEGGRMDGRVMTDV